MKGMIIPEDFQNDQYILSGHPNGGNSPDPEPEEVN